MSRTTSDNTDTRILVDGFSIAAGKTSKRTMTISGGDVALVGSGFTYTFPTEAATLGVLTQYDTGSITASTTSPLVIELPITMRSPYRFPAVQIMRFVSDELDGRWRVASLGIDYNLEFYGGTTMHIEFYTSGDFKVNY